MVPRFTRVFETGFPRFRLVFLGRGDFLGNWVGFMRTGHLCMNVVVNRDEMQEVCKEKMKNTMEKMKRLFREDDASENMQVKSESEK